MEAATAPEVVKEGTSGVANGLGVEAEVSETASYPTEVRARVLYMHPTR